MFHLPSHVLLIFSPLIFFLSLYFPSPCTFYPCDFSPKIFSRKFSIIGFSFPIHFSFSFHFISSYLPSHIISSHYLTLYIYFHNFYLLTLFSILALSWHLVFFSYSFYSCTFLSPVFFSCSFYSYTL